MVYYPGVAAAAVVAPTWTPADLPGLVHWWHSVLSAKTSSLGAVSQINDLVGSLHLTQGTGAAQPTDNTRTINGKVALDFDGSDDALNGATGASLTANGTAYVFWIGKVDTLVSADMLFHTGGFTAGNDGFCLSCHSAGGGRLLLSWSNGTTGETYGPTTPVITTTGPHLVECWIIGTTGGANFAIDGVDAAGATNTVGYATPEELNWFTRAGTLNELDGAGCEWGIVNGAVPGSSDRADLLAYAQDYWGTP
jgi:hypothetical protein